MQLRTLFRGACLTSRTLLVTAALGTSSLASGAPLVVPDSNCFAAPADANCVSIAYSEGDFGSFTYDRSVAVIEPLQLFGLPPLAADNSQLPEPPPERKQDTDFIRAFARQFDDGDNEVVEAVISGEMALAPGALGAGPGDSLVSACVNVIGSLASSAPDGTVVQVPIQIDHDGGISNVPTTIGEYQNGSSVAILWQAQADLFTSSTQTTVFSGSLDVDEQSLAINASGFSGADYVFFDENVDGWFGTYANSEPIFPTVSIRVGEPFTLKLFVFAEIFSDYTDLEAPPLTPLLENDSGDSFSVRLVLPPGTTFLPAPEPGFVSSMGIALLSLAAAGRRRRHR